MHKFDGLVNFFFLKIKVNIFFLFGEHYHLIFLFAQMKLIVPNTWPMFYINHVHYNSRQYRLNQLQAAGKTVTQGMKSNILGSVTVGHKNQIQWARIIDFYKLSFFLRIYILTTNIQCKNCNKIWRKSIVFYNFTNKMGPLPVLPDSPRPFST